MTAELPTAPALPPLRQRVILATSVLQGLLLYWLYHAVERSLWPSDDPLVLHALGSLFLTAPLFLLFLIADGNLRLVARCTAGYAAAVTLLGAYAGWMAGPVDLVEPGVLLPAFVVTILILSFKSLIYAQQYVRGQDFDYAALLQNSWRLFLLGALSALFVLLFWLVLLLWGALFDQIGVGIFEDVFDSDPFRFPASTVAFGFAVILFHNLEHVVATLARLLQTMLRFLLPLLALVAVLFLAFLPFTGLDAVWSTRIGSALFLWLIALLLFFTNAVYRGGEVQLPLPRWLHRLVALALAGLPVFALLALHGLFTRIAQYGVTVDRLWGVIVAVLGLVFSLGYLWNIATRRDDWALGVPRLNRALGLVLVAVLVAVNTPLLNLQKISVTSQLARLDRGLAIREFDIRYFRYSLGRPGWEALNDLKTRYANDAEFVASIDELYRKPSETPLSIADLRSQLIVWPSGRQVPGAIEQQLLSDTQGNRGLYSGLFALFADLDSDGRDEVVTVLTLGTGYAASTLWVQDANGQWARQPLQTTESLTRAALEQALAAGAVRLEAPRWQNLRVGDDVFVPMQTPAPLPPR